MRNPLSAINVVHGIYTFVTRITVYGVEIVGISYHIVRLLLGNEGSIIDNKRYVIKEIN